MVPMNTKTFVVQHEWDEAKTSEVVPVVSGIITNAKSGKLPSGFNLLGVMLAKEAPKAYCVWQSESKESLEQLLASVNPPTKHVVSEFDAVYGITRA
ncbi:MAG: hypothetical protein JRM82_04710 [Nitrososphaerota archaeon]|nr:hypothetical protein [Nitrososphaerota archaeon]